MPAIAIDTPFNISIDLTIASVGKRMLAILIDSVILFIYQYIASWALNSMDGYNDGWIIFLRIFVLVLPIAFYHFLLEVFFSGQSVGKRIMGIRVVNFNGNEASISQYFLRMLFRAHIVGPLIAYVLASLFMNFNSSDRRESFYVVFFVLWLMVSLGLFLYFLINKYNQRLGDNLANTLVIETHSKADIHKTIHLDITDQAYKVRYPEVMRLTDRDINGIRNLLDVKRLTKDSEAYMERIAHRIVQVLNIQTDQAPYDFLAQLLRDYNYLTSK